MRRYTRAGAPHTAAAALALMVGRAATRRRRRRRWCRCRRFRCVERTQSHPVVERNELSTEACSSLLLYRGCACRWSGRRGGIRNSKKGKERKREREGRGILRSYIVVYRVEKIVRLLWLRGWVRERNGKGKLLSHNVLPSYTSAYCLSMLAASFHSFILFLWSHVSVYP